MKPFVLTPPPDRATYEWSKDNGRTWRGLSYAEFERLVERGHGYPDDTIEKVDAGGTVRLYRISVNVCVRKRKTRVQEDDDRRQGKLL
jgi:hypothetical protein